jgi:predicted  nucleic acid-binding Zn-ribbon protein
LRASYEKKIKAIEDKIAKAMDAVQDQKSQANSAKMDTAMRVGSTLLGALLGKRISTTSGRGAMSGASKAWKESRDVARAEEKVDEYQSELEKIEADCEEQVEKLKATIDPMTERLETLTVTPLKKNCACKAVGIAWMPYRVNAQPTLGAAW